MTLSITSLLMQALIEKYGNIHAVASLAGVPRSTAHRWADGSRNPSAAAKRLLEVMLEHDIRPPPVEPPDAPPDAPPAQ
jgi:hypothetical protein